MKVIILCDASKPDSKQHQFKKYQTPNNSSSKITKAMLHELHSNFSNNEESDTEKNENKDSVSSDGEINVTLLVNSATHKNVLPSNIRKLLSVPSKKKPLDKEPKKKDVSINETKSKIDNNSKEGITLNGKTYRFVNNTITYSFSKHMRAYTESLVDIGANRGVAGEDTGAIFTNPDRKVNIRGIDDHEIDSISIITASGVTKTTSGEIIVILNQYFYHGKGKGIHSAG